MRFTRFITPALFTLLATACGPTTGSTPADDAASDSVSSDASVTTEAATLEDTPAPPLDEPVSPADVRVMPDTPAPPTDAPTPPRTDASVGDAPDPFADAGALGPPAPVPVTVVTRGTCPALTACGGAIAGTWDVSGVCIEVPIADTVALCPGAMITRADGQARGRVVFGTAPAIARRVAEANVQVDLTVPAVCARLLGGCAALQATIVLSAPDTVCTASSAGDCACTSRVRSVIDDGDLYATRSNEIVSETTGKRWGYCVAGAELRYVDRSATGPREPGVVSLRRRE